MSKHTPGPWKAHFNGDGMEHEHGDIVTDEYLIAHVECSYGPIGEPEANARLIAAAPQMYEALKGLFAWAVVAYLEIANSTIEYAGGSSKSMDSYAEIALMVKAALEAAGGSDDAHK